MSTTKLPARRVAAGVAALALAAAGVVGAGSATTAHAAPLGSITIHQYLSETQVAPSPDGRPVTNVPADAKPIRNFCWSVERVDYATVGGPKIDLLSNQQSWTDIQGLKAPVDPALLGRMSADYVSFGACTDATGSLNWGGLQPGLYQLRPFESQTFSPEIVDPATGTATPVSGKINNPAPFLVTIPMGTDLATANYDINAYPKATMRGVRKTVADQGVFVQGDRLQYTIDGDVRPTAAAGDLRQFTIVDDLDEQRLLLAPSDIVVKAFNGTTEIALDPATDYTLTVDQQLAHLKVDFTRAGLDKLGAAAINNRAVRVSVTISPLSKGLPLQGPDVLNSAQLIDDGGVTTSNTVTTKRSRINLTKVNDKGQPLAGAVFELWACTTDAAGNVTAKLHPMYTDSTHATIARLTTNNNGTIETQGGTWSSFANNADVLPAQQVKYCFYEVQAPSGYQLLTAPVVATLDATTVQNPNDYALVTVSATNIPNTFPLIPLTLPMTGGAGVAALIAGGLAVAGAGTVLARRKVA